MKPIIEGKIYRVGKMFNKTGACYVIYQKLENGIIYYNVYKDNEKPVNIHCAYSDIGYLLKVKGF